MLSIWSSLKIFLFGKELVLSWTTLSRTIQLIISAKTVQFRILTTMPEQAFEKIMGKEENAIPTRLKIFFTLPKTNTSLLSPFP